MNGIYHVEAVRSLIKIGRGLNRACQTAWGILHSLSSKGCPAQMTVRLITTKDSNDMRMWTPRALQGLEHWLDSRAGSTAMSSIELA